MCSNNRGFTLVELMVSLLIMTVGLLGLFQAVYSSIAHSMGNDLRNEGASYADELMAKQVNQPFDSIATGLDVKDTARRSLNGGLAFAQFSSELTTARISDNSTSIQLTVSWKHKGVRNTQMVAGVVTK